MKMKFSKSKIYYIFNRENPKNTNMQNPHTWDRHFKDIDFHADKAMHYEWLWKEMVTRYFADRIDIKLETRISFLWSKNICRTTNMTFDKEDKCKAVASHYSAELVSRSIFATQYEVYPGSRNFRSTWTHHPSMPSFPVRQENPVSRDHVRNFSW